MLCSVMTTFPHKRKNFKVFSVYYLVSKMTSLNSLNFCLKVSIIFVERDICTVLCFMPTSRCDANVRMLYSKEQKLSQFK